MNSTNTNIIFWQIHSWKEQKMFATKQAESQATMFRNPFQMHCWRYWRTFTRFAQWILLRFHLLPLVFNFCSLAELPTTLLTAWSVYLGGRTLSLARVTVLTQPKDCAAVLVHFKTAAPSHNFNQTFNWFNKILVVPLPSSSESPGQWFSTFHGLCSTGSTGE